MASFFFRVLEYSTQLKLWEFGWCKKSLVTIRKMSYFFRMKSSFPSFHSTWHYERIVERIMWISFGRDPAWMRQVQTMIPLVIPCKRAIPPCCQSSRKVSWVTSITKLQFLNTLGRWCVWNYISNELRIYHSRPIQFCHYRGWCSSSSTNNNKHSPRQWQWC